MKSREVNITGRTNGQGGLLIANQSEMSEFFKGWPNVKIIGSFRVYKPGSSEALKGYYFNKIVPDFRRALWESGDRKTLEDCEKFLRELCPITISETVCEKSGKYESELREISDLDNSELCELIEHLRQIAAEEFSFVIDDPKVY